MYMSLVKNLEDLIWDVWDKSKENIAYYRLRFLSFLWTLYYKRLL